MYFNKTIIISTLFVGVALSVSIPTSTEILDQLLKKYQIKSSSRQNSGEYPPIKPPCGSKQNSGEFPEMKLSCGSNQNSGEFPPNKPSISSRQNSGEFPPNKPSISSKQNSKEIPSISSNEIMNNSSSSESTLSKSTYSGIPAVQGLFDLLNNTLTQVIELLRRLLTPEQYAKAMEIANNNNLTKEEQVAELKKWASEEGGSLPFIIDQILQLVDEIRKMLFGKLEEIADKATGPVQSLLIEIIGIYKNDSLDRIDECFEVTKLTTVVLMDKPAVLQELLRVVGAIPQCVVGNLVGQLLTGNLLTGLLGDVTDIITGLNLPILGVILSGDGGLLGGLLGGGNGGLLGGLLGGGLPIVGGLLGGGNSGESNGGLLGGLLG